MKKQRVKDLKPGDVFEMSGRQYKVRRIHQEEVIYYPIGQSGTFSTVPANSNRIIEILSDNNEPDRNT